MGWNGGTQTHRDANAFGAVFGRLRYERGIGGELAKLSMNCLRNGARNKIRREFQILAHLSSKLFGRDKRLCHGAWVSRAGLEER